MRKIISIAALLGTALIGITATDMTVTADGGDHAELAGTSWSGRYPTPKSIRI